MRVWTRLAATLVAVGVLAVVPATAWADPRPSTTTSGPMIPIRWDGPATALSWDGHTYALAGDSFFGGLKYTVPGDRVERTAIIKNNGPTGAIAKIEIGNIVAGASDNEPTGQLENLLHLYWKVNGTTTDEVWSHLRDQRDAAGMSYSTSFSLAQGEEFPLTVGYYFPAEATSGNGEASLTSAFSFEIRITMQGDTETITPTAEPTLGPKDGSLISSGGVTAAGTLLAWGGLIGIGLGLAGLTTARLMRRRASVAQR